MFVSRSKGLLAIALLATGCGTAPLAAPTSLDALEAPLVEPGGEYSLLALGPSFVKVDGICASSTKNKYFPACQVTDGNTHTAWAPDPCDNCPTLTLDLCGAFCLDGLWIKQSGCKTTVDVQVWTPNGWVDAGCGLQPTATVLSHLNIQGIGTKVRLKFRGCDPRCLLVCDVRLCGKKFDIPVITIPGDVIPL
ncbi:MAG: hypothetical protein JWM80_4300 [Cyanobacteria bacterium RYN_339]|nr:hypothetical protein [Cyanobacteria bacterium RYN_339]